MTAHRIKTKSVHDSPRGARKLGTCSVCGENVPVVRSPLSWRCVEGERLKQAAKRKTAADYALKKNGKPRKAPGKAKGRSLSVATERLARKACLEEFGHKCSARGLYGIECGDPSGSRASLEWCHILGRNHRTLKFHPENCFLACPAHHDFLDGHPATKIEFVEYIKPGRMSKLAELERTLPRGENAKFWNEYYREQGFKL